MSVPSRPYPLGVSLRDGTANVAVYTETAELVEICIITDDGEERIPLRYRTGYVFHDLVPQLTPGTRYGLRVHGEWAPERGLRHNPNKLLLDPHATAITGEYDWGQAVFGHDFDAPERMNTEDSAGKVPLSVVTDPGFDWEGDEPPRIPHSESVIYEVHVKGFTATHPGVPEHLRGTYAGLANPAAIQHLVDLGITTVELLPVHQFVQDSHLLERDLRNYWGYNSIGFFAPHGDYAAGGDGGQQVDEFKGMVKALHQAGIEVILDVVFNHTAEGNHMGPMLSFKGIDNSSYYRLVDDDPSFYFDTTGTGNSLNVGHPAALRIIMDSLRYWVTEMHVDGFRFDLATTLTRQDGDPDKHSAFLSLVHQDAVLSKVKLIAEPWDVAGYQLGGFPPEWAEWNGRFRDDVRDFWNGDDAVLGAVTQRVLGSPDVYEASRRSPLSSVNLITAHDGFTLADLVAYEEKHTAANGEDGRDGESHNRSNNHGAEGPTDDPEILATRARQQRNFLATLLLSAGMPMLLGGDELGRTQQGNNNAYCQDNEVSWFDWANVDEGLLEFTRRLIALRHAEPALRPDWFRHAPEAGTDATVSILRADGKGFEDADWSDHDARAVQILVGNVGCDSFAILFNSAGNGVEFTVADAPGEDWSLELSSDEEQRVAAPVTTLIVRDHSFTLLRSKRVGEALSASDEPVPDGAYTVEFEALPTGAIDLSELHDDEKQD